MAYVEDASVPDAAADKIENDDSCKTYGGRLGLGASKGVTHLGRLTRSGSRKRLCPDALPCSNDSVPGAGALAWEIADDPAMTNILRGYRSFPGEIQNPDNVRTPPRSHANNHARGTNRTTTKAVVEKPQGSDGVRKDHVEVGLLGSHLPKVTEFLPQHVPDLAPEVITTSVTIASIAASGLAVSTTSAGLVPSTQPLLPPPPLRAALYAELLSGAGFSYAADGDEVFDADAVSMGSLTSGSYMFGCDEDNYQDEGDSEFSPSGTWSPGTGYSGSGQRPGVAVVAPVLNPPPTVHNCGPRGSMPMVIVEEQEQEGSPLARSKSSESVGSANDADFQVSSFNARTQAAVGVGIALKDGDMGTAGDAADAAYRLGGVLRLPSGAVGWEGVATGTAAVATAATRPHAVAVPALLPPEVYLGFVTQLVESVRTATQIVDAACQTATQSGPEACAAPQL